MQTKIIPFPLHARMRAANDDNPTGPGGNAVSPRLVEAEKPNLVLFGQPIEAQRLAA